MRTTPHLEAVAIAADDANADYLVDELFDDTALEPAFGGDPRGGFYFFAFGALVVAWVVASAVLGEPLYAAIGLGLVVCAVSAWLSDL